MLKNMAANAKAIYLRQMLGIWIVSMIDRSPSLLKSETEMRSWQIMWIQAREFAKKKFTFVSPKLLKYRAS